MIDQSQARIPANSEYRQLQDDPLDSPQQQILGASCKCPICHQSGQTVYLKEGTKYWARRCPHCEIKYEVKPRGK